MLYPSTRKGYWMTGLFSTSSPGTERAPSTPELSFIVLLPRLLVIFATLTLVVNAALPQLEMAVSGGSILFMPRQLTVLIVCFTSVLLLKGKFQHSPLLLLTALLVGYCALDAIFLYFYRGLSIAAIRSCLDSFTFLIAAGIASFVPLQFKSRNILRILLGLTLACLVVSVAQFVTNSPVVRTDSNDQIFHVQSYDFLGQTRSFSLFANGLDAGVFYSFMGAIATSFVLNRKTRGYGLALLPLCAFGCYATYTRLAMVGFIVSTAAVFVLTRRGFSALSRVFPVVSLGCAVLVVVQALGTSGGASRKDLANIASLDQRIFAWGVYGGKFLAGSAIDILFGTGQGPYTPYTSSGRLENAAPMPVDNAYLLLLLGTGLVGLSVIGASYWHFWSYLQKRSVQKEDHLLKGIAGVFASVPFFCLINDIPTQTILLLLLAVSLSEEGDTVPLPKQPALQQQYLRTA